MVYEIDHSELCKLKFITYLSIRSTGKIKRVMINHNQPLNYHSSKRIEINARQNTTFTLPESRIILLQRLATKWQPEHKITKNYCGAKNGRKQIFLPGVNFPWRGVLGRGDHSLIRGYFVKAYMIHYPISGISKVFHWNL